MSLRRSPHDAVIAAGYLFGGAALYAGLPSEIPPSWNLGDRGVIWLGGPMVAFLLPTASAVACRLLRDLFAKSLTGESDTTYVTAVYDAIVLRLTMFVLGVHGTVLAGLLGWLWGREWAAQIVPIMLGLTMIGVGNLLPLTRPNLAIGIRTSRTLSNRTCWRRTHRLAGYVLVGGGCVVVLAAITVPIPFGPGMILIVGPAVALGMSLLAVRVVTQAESLSD